MHPPVSV